MSFLELRQRVHSMALGLAILVAACIPLLFIIVSYRHEAEELGFRADLSASKLSKYIFANEAMWQYQRVRLAEIIEFNSNTIDVHQLVTDAAGRAVLSVGSPALPPYISHSSPIVVSGRLAGELTATLSLRPLLGEFIITALGSWALAAACYMAVRTMPLRALDRTLSRLETTHADLVRANDQLVRQAQQLGDAQRLGRLGHWHYSFSTRMFEWAPEALELIGYERAETVRTPAAVLQLCMPESRQLLLEADRRLKKVGSIEKIDIKFLGPTGGVIDLCVIAHADHDAEGNTLGFSGTIQDISDRKRAEEQLEQLAYYDPLTGLANRTLFKRVLDASFIEGDLGSKSGALLLIDLDHFKEVNDTLGHAAGDDMLIEVVRRIQAVLERSHFFARLGGDEFAVFIRGTSDTDAIDETARRVLSAATGEMTLEAAQVVSGASIGVSLLGRDGTTSAELMRNADLALYHAKGAGRGCVSFFDPCMDAEMRNKSDIARELRQCMHDGHGLQLHYQPQIDLATGRVAGFEALARWTSPTRGSVPPSVFIPVAENSRLICELGVWALRAAAVQAKAWIDAGEPLREIAVNVSAAQIWHSDLLGEVDRILSETGLPPHLLCLELTETLMANQSDGRVRTVLSNLKTRGVTLALDDFGTGYSSLSYLAELPFDKLKIDRSFVRKAMSSAHARELLKGIISLGHGLGLKVQAEGAEDMAEVDVLREFKADLVQGYAFARPAPAAAALAYARERAFDDLDIADGDADCSATIAA